MIACGALSRYALEAKSVWSVALSLVLGIVYIVVGGINLALILLHSGRGGGLSDMFGGGLGATAAGSTSVERNLDRMTIFFSILFTILTLVMVFQLDGS